MELALFSAMVAFTCEEHSVFWSIENPRNSRLWDFDPISELRTLDSTIEVLTVHCSFMSGPFYLKPTRILTNLCALSYLESGCSQDHVHTVLEGRESFVASDGVRRSRNRTAGAGAYPARLCQAWALAARLAAPPLARGLERPALDTVLLSRISHGSADRSTGASRRSSSRFARRTQSTSDLWPGAAGDESCGLQKRYDHLRPFIVFGQDSNLEVERKRAAKRGRGKLGRWPSVARL